MTDTETTAPAEEPTPDEVAPEPTGPKYELIPIEVLTEHPAEKPPRFYMIGSDLVAQTDEGQLTLSLRIKTSNAERLDEIPGRRKRLDAILAANGQESVSAVLDELDIIDTGTIVDKWYQAWDQRNAARLGESFRSSTS